MERLEWHCHSKRVSGALYKAILYHGQSAGKEMANSDVFNFRRNAGSDWRNPVTAWPTQQPETHYHQCTTFVQHLQFFDSDVLAKFAGCLTFACQWSVIDCFADDGRTDFDTSIVASMEVNGIVYQGVLFAQPPNIVGAM